MTFIRWIAFAYISGFLLGCGSKNGGGGSTGDTATSPPGPSTSRPGQGGTDEGGGGAAYNLPATPAAFLLKGNMGSSLKLLLAEPRVPTAIWGLRLKDKSLPRGIFGGSMVKEVPIDEDGNFNIEFDISANGQDQDDWVFLLVDPDQTNPRDRVISPLNIKSGSDGLMRMPIAEIDTEQAKQGPADAPTNLRLADGESSSSEAATPITLDIGNIELSGTTGNAISEKTIEDSASVFKLNVSQLKQMADTDNALKHVVNYYVNYKKGAASDGSDFYYRATPNFNWSTDAAPVKNAWSDPEVFSEAQFSLNFASNDRRFNFNEFCSANASKSVEIVPPTTILNAYTQQTMVFKNVGTPTIYTDMTTPVCHISSLILQEQFRDTNVFDEYWLSFNDAKLASSNGKLTGIPEGLWELRVDNQKLADFDLAAANPFDQNGKPTIYIPSLKVDVDATSKEILKISVKWFYWDKDATATNGGQGAYVEVKDTTVLRKTVGNPILFWTAFDWPVSGQRTEEYFNFTDGFENTTFKKKWYFAETQAELGQLQSAEKPVPASISAGYDIGGVRYGWGWQPR